MAPFSAAAPLLPALVQERSLRTPLATVWVLNTLEPVIGPLRQAIAGLIVFRGHPEAARRYETNLKAAGLPTSVNLLMSH
ncbi:MAG: hypothetical protein NT158_09845 [Cyanobacteria bacterium]|nr:hypothetical protein [Cyanobacteriota bacterium]